MADADDRIAEILEAEKDVVEAMVQIIQELGGGKASQVMVKMRLQKAMTNGSFHRAEPQQRPAVRRERGPQPRSRAPRRSEQRERQPRDRAEELSERDQAMVALAKDMAFILRSKKVFSAFVEEEATQAGLQERYDQLVPQGYYGDAPQARPINNLCRRMANVLLDSEKRQDFRDKEEFRDEVQRHINRTLRGSGQDRQQSGPGRGRRGQGRRRQEGVEKAKAKVEQVGGDALAKSDPAPERDPKLDMPF